MDRLRVIEVVNVRWFNATAWYGLSLSRLLLDAGHEVRCLALPGTQCFDEARRMGLEPVPLSLHSANPALFGPAALKAAALVRDFRPHVVNCHRGEGFFLWGLLKKKSSGYALVRTRGDQRPPKGNWPNRYLHARFVDALIAANSRTASQCMDTLGLEKAKVFTVPGGVDARRFAPDAEGRARVRRAYGFTDDDLVVGLLGRFDPVKGQRELIDALGRILPVRNLRERLKVLLLGLPASLSQEDIASRLRERGLAERAVLLGRVDDVPAHINAFDLGVVASQGSEAIARAALEIMACGVPLVSTDVGVMPDLLVPEALAPVGDGEALAALMLSFLLNGEARAALVHGQRERMRHLTHEAFLEQTLAVYRQAMSRAASADA